MKNKSGHNLKQNDLLFLQAHVNGLVLKGAAVELLNVDCMELMAKYPDKHFDLAIVDPPYGIGIDKAINANNGKQGYKQYRDTDWDSNIPDAEYWKQLFRVSKNQIVWGGNYMTKYLPPSMGWIVWNKKQREFTMADGELAWTSFDKAIRIFDYARGSALANNNTNGGKTHPTQKPKQLYKWCLKNYAKVGDKILDTHLGSGTIALAVDDINKIDKMNLMLTGSEIDVEYYNEMLKRIKECTAQNSLF